MCPRRWPFILPLLAAFCAVPLPVQAESLDTDAASADSPRGATIGTSGFATILTAPPVPYPDAPPPPDPNRIWQDPESALQAELAANPDEASLQAAMALDRRLKIREVGNYIGVRVVRDPQPRHGFQFRRDAAVSLARHTDDPRFVAIEGGVPADELQPLANEWRTRFEPHRIGGGGYVDAFEGVVHFDMNIDEEGFRSIAETEGWTLPDRLRLSFAPPPNENATDPVLERMIRVLPREDRVPAAVLSAAISGRIILRDGCFRLASSDPTQGEALVIFGRDVELVLDDEGYMAIRNPHRDEPAARIGEVMVWAGPRGLDERDTGVHALRAACGDGPIESVGEPASAYHFRVRPWAIDDLARGRGISRQQAWDALKECWARADANAAASDRIPPASSVSGRLCGRD